MFPVYVSSSSETDPEFIERYDNFAFGEINNTPGVGLDNKSFLIAVVSQCLPYIGYPRSLNAHTCVNNAAKQFE